MEAVGLSAPLDGYCERLGPGLWAEPVNAVTNAAFLVAAAWAWRRTGPKRTGTQTVLIALIAAIGIGSALLHTVARMWAGIADVVPIALFVLVYLHAATRDILGASRRASLLAVMAFLAFAAVAGTIFAALPFLSRSAPYWPVALVIALYAAAAPDRRTGGGLAVGAALLTLSLTARSLDMHLCDALPMGTHFLWHLLNGALLAWMVEIHRRHLARAADAT